MMFMLTDTSQIAYHGSFETLAEAKNYAVILQQWELCKSYSIGKYIDRRFVEVYNSNKDYLFTMV